MSAPCSTCVCRMARASSECGRRLQHAIGDRELADVVQPAAEPAADGDGLRQAELDGDAAGQLGDLLAVVLGRRLADGDREREAAGQLEHLGLVGGELLDRQRR